MHLLEHPSFIAVLCDKSSSTGIIILATFGIPQSTSEFCFKTLRMYAPLAHECKRFPPSLRPSASPPPHFHSNIPRRSSFASGRAKHLNLGCENLRKSRSLVIRDSVKMRLDPILGSVSYFLSVKFLLKVSLIGDTACSHATLIS